MCSQSPEFRVTPDETNDAGKEPVQITKPLSVGLERGADTIARTLDPQSAEFTECEAALCPLY